MDRPNFRDFGLPWIQKSMQIMRANRIHSPILRTAELLSTATQNLKLVFDVVDEETYFNVFVKVGYDRVGELKAEKVDEGRARLSEIRMRDDWLRRRTWGERLRSRPFVKIESCSFQGQGIGSNLLTAFFAWCRRRKIDHVYGSVVASDLIQSPALLDWYRKRGFRIEEPSEECLPMAVKMVVWNGNENSKQMRFISNLTDEMTNGT